MRNVLNDRQLKKLKYARDMTGTYLLRDFEGVLTDSWIQFFAKSPDTTIFHSTEYTRYAFNENGFGDMLLVEYQGNPCFAIPVHWGGVLSITTGYSGVVFPDSTTEKQIRHFVERFVDFINLNPHLRIEVIQSAQSATTFMSMRRNLISSYIHKALIQDRQGTFTRVIDLCANEAPNLSKQDWLMENLESKIRNQIKKAIEKGVRTTSSDLSDKTLIDQFIDQYYLIHAETFLRTGQNPHSKSHFINLLDGLLTIEGSCTGTIASYDGTPIAGVISTRFRDLCLYWSGCSTTLGQKMNGNAAALFGAMEYNANLGAKYYETGRFNRKNDNVKEVSITHFKSQFGGGYIPVESFLSEGAKSLPVIFVKSLMSIVVKIGSN